MRIFRYIVSIMLGLTQAASVPCTASSPGEMQVRKLAAATWKDKPLSIDVTLYKQVIRPTKSTDEFREMYEKAFDQIRPVGSLRPNELEVRDREVQQNVERALKEQEVGQKTKERIRIAGYRKRMDQVFGRPEVVLLKGTPHERTMPEIPLDLNTPYEMTIVHAGDPDQKDYTNFKYFHSGKTAEISNAKSGRWKITDVMELAQFPFDMRGILGREEQVGGRAVYVPDEKKMEIVSTTGSIDKTVIQICPDTNNPNTRDRIEIKTQGKLNDLVAIVCDKNDYSRVYYIRITNPLTGTPLMERRCSDYDNQGFPHSVTTTEYGLDGEFKKKEIIKVEKVELNPSLPDEIFEFRPPEGYAVRDLRTDKQASGKPSGS